MEKFSSYRDLGTGIQPFLPPVPPPGPYLLAKIALPIQYIIGIVRTALVLVFIAVYLVLVPGLGVVFSLIPPLRRAISHLITAIITRGILFLLGFFSIPVKQARKKGRAQNQAELWKPRAGDVIVSNWVSWIELLWLAFRFNPIFVLPISDAPALHTLPAQDSSPITHTPGRRHTGAGSANIQSSLKVTSTPLVPILGFQALSLFSIIRLTGHTPPFGYRTSESHFSTLEDLRKNADRPLVVFPECTTSNGRGLLRFARVFSQSVPVKAYQVFVMCVRYDPPTVMSPTLTWSIPSLSLNPLPHIFTLASSISLPTISIQLIPPSESPSSQLFIVSEIMTDSTNTSDQLTEVCATLIARTGKMKKMRLGWEDKANFLDFYRDKQK